MSPLCGKVKNALCLSASAPGESRIIQQSSDPAPKLPKQKYLWCPARAFFCLEVFQKSIHHPLSDFLSLVCLIKRNGQKVDVVVFSKTRYILWQDVIIPESCFMDYLTVKFFEMGKKHRYPTIRSPSQASTNISLSLWNLTQIQQTLNKVCEYCRKR